MHRIAEGRRLVSWDALSDCYTWISPHIKLKGITKPLKQRFYPRASRPAKVRAAPSVAGWIKGRKGGSQVHEQLRDLVKQGDPKGERDPRVMTIMSEVRARNWKILDAEYCVGDRDLRLGTGVDLLCVTQAGTPVIVEIKCGFDSVSYTGPTKRRLKKPLSMLDDSPYSQHQIQLLLTRFLFEKTTGLKQAGAEVWVVGHPRGPLEMCNLRVYPLHPDLAREGRTVATLLSASTKIKPIKTK